MSSRTGISASLADFSARIAQPETEQSLRSCLLTVYAPAAVVVLILLDELDRLLRRALEARLRPACLVPCARAQASASANAAIACSYIYV